MYNEGIEKECVKFGENSRHLIQEGNVFLTKFEWFFKKDFFLTSRC